MPFLLRERVPYGAAPSAPASLSATTPDELVMAFALDLVSGSEDRGSFEEEEKKMSASNGRVRGVQATAAGRGWDPGEASDVRFAGFE